MAPAGVKDTLVVIRFCQMIGWISSDVIDKLSVSSVHTNTAMSEGNTKRRGGGANCFFWQVLRQNTILSLSLAVHYTTLL